MSGPLSVDEAAQALGTSPQTVRTMLRKGELPGERRPWGARYVWLVNSAGLDDFLAQYGRLEGGRRQARPAPGPGAEEGLGPAGTAARSEAVTGPSTERAGGSPLPDVSVVEDQPARDSRPVVLRPRGRATVMVVVLGIPLLLGHVATRTLPDAWWFQELGQADVFRRLLLVQVELRLLVFLPVAIFVGANLGAALRGVTGIPRSAVAAVVVVGSLVCGGMFASAAAGHWETFVLWRHRQSFGTVDPIHGRDVGYFVFSLPFELLVSTLLLWLVAVTAGLVVVVLTVRGQLTWRPRRAGFGAQVQLFGLASAFLLALAWRFHLEQYVLELQQPASGDGDSFAGADYTDVHVRTPGLAALADLSILLAIACVVSPFWSRRRARRTHRVFQVPLVALLTASAMVSLLLPAVVQRYVVDPSPLLREQPFLAHSVAGTRAALGLDGVALAAYSPTHSFTATDFPDVTDALSRVQIWDNPILGARMRQLVTDTPYFRPDDQALDVVPVDGRPQPTVVGTRELDLSAVKSPAESWTNDRLAYTHGLGVIRFSGNDTGTDRGPRLLDSGLGADQPRIYFGNLAGETSPDADAGVGAAPSQAARLAQSAWVLVDTRRPEVDATTAVGTSQTAYHYTGPAGIPLSNLMRRAVFAVGMDSKQLLLSHDITPESRILLHRDVHDRLHTLAPFIDWDSSAVPLTTDGHVLFVVDGYTTSTSYPYAERVGLGGARVSYARASVRATVDAFTGEVDMYLTDPDDPVVQAWAEAFPSLFQPESAMPSELRSRLRYPADLFDAQATAYERFHTLDPSVFASSSDVWSRPIALSGPIEVASGVDFDESDEDDLNLTLGPGYSYSTPPGRSDSQLVLSTYYSPRSGQNLVATLQGWIDGQGRPQLGAMSLPRDPVTLGPAQISRQVFSTPRVSNLLGLRNLEVRDLDKSSLDSVILGRPHLLFLPGGLMQIQSLYEGSRGPGAARLLGVTAYIDGRAGLGPDIDSAVRQALNEPPQVSLPQPRGAVTVGDRVTLRFEVQNAQRETVLITSPDGQERMHRQVTTGSGSVTWEPATVGTSHVTIEVEGLDGTQVKKSISVHVLDHPPTVQLLRAPASAVVGTHVRIPFRITRSDRALATVSTLSGIVFTRHFDLPHGRGVLDWTPAKPGGATIVVQATGEEGQTASATWHLDVGPATSTVAPPAVELLHVPESPTVGVPGVYALRASGCTTAIARIEGPGQDPLRWSFPCPVQDATFTWTPTAPGSYVLRTLARDPDGVASSQTSPFTVVPGPGTPPAPGPSSTPSSTPSAAPTSSPLPSLPSAPLSPTPSRHVSLAVVERGEVSRP